MVLGTVEAFTTMAALAALLLATCYNLLAGLGRGCLRQNLGLRGSESPDFVGSRAGGSFCRAG